MARSKKDEEKSYCIDNDDIGEHNIASLFANKYGELYNSVRYNEQSFNSIISENIDDLSRSVLYLMLTPSVI